MDVDIPHDSYKHKSYCHNRTLGEEGVDDNSKQSHNNNDIEFCIAKTVLVLSSFPRKEGGVVVGGFVLIFRGVFHRNAIDYSLGMIEEICFFRKKEIPWFSIVNVLHYNI